MKFTGERFVPELRGQIAYEHRHRYAAALDFARDRDVLDVACGEGYGASLLAPVARSVTGVDIDEASIRHAASRYVATNLTYRSGPATALPLPDDSIDLIVSFETVEHVAEQRAMMAEFARVLRGDGRLLISSPNKLVYSDARGYANEYHVAELYFDEFRDLLCEFFPRVRLFGQRVIGGSAIHPLHGTAGVSRWLDGAGRATSGIVALPDPEYFVALCAKDPGDDLADMTSVYLDPADDLLQDIRGGGLSASNGHAVKVVVAAEPSPERATDEDSMLALERLDARVTALAREREQLAARVAEFERERDELRARLGVAIVDLELSAARIFALERERERIAKAEFERDEASTELAVTALERDLGTARALELERECEAAAARIAALEAAVARADALGGELERAGERVAEAERERDAATSRVTLLERERDRQNERRARAETERVAVRGELRAAVEELERARAHGVDLERERERILAHVAGTAGELATVQAALAAALAARDADQVRIVELQLHALSLAGMLEESQGLLRRSEAVARASGAHLFDARGDAARLRTGALDLEAQVANLLAALGRSGTLARALGAAVTRAAQALASLELTRLQLESNLATRVAAAETKAAQASAAAARLRSELALVVDALALRERRIVLLEGVLRNIADENVRAVERERRRATALLANLQASKFFTLRSAVRKLLRAAATRAGLRD